MDGTALGERVLDEDIWESRARKYVEILARDGARPAGLYLKLFRKKMPLFLEALWDLYGGGFDDRLGGKGS